jgi:small subunit ribosomal protein S15
MPLPKTKKEELIHQFQTHEADTGSPEVQVALLTGRITQLADHLKANKHDHDSRRGLLKLVGQRRRHLVYMSKKDAAGYKDLVARLGLRK